MPNKVSQDLVMPQYAGFEVKIISKNDLKNDSKTEVDLSTISSNRVELLKQSKKAEFNNYSVNIGGSSHVGKVDFVSALNMKFWDGLERKRDVVFPGAILSVSGGGIQAAGSFVKFARKVSEEVGYQGQLFLLVLGTNDASDALLDQSEYFEKYQELCKTLLSIPKLVLMPTSLLPRSYDSKFPQRNPNMLPTSDTIRAVCADLRRDSQLANRVKFVNAYDNIGELKTDSKLGIKTLVPLKGMLKKDNVHLTPDASKILADNLLKGANLLHNKVLNSPTNNL